MKIVLHFLFDMAEVFEKFIWKYLQKTKRPKCKNTKSKKLCNFALKPDISIKYNNRYKNIK